MLSVSKYRPSAINSFTQFVFSNLYLAFVLCNPPWVVAMGDFVLRNSFGGGAALLSLAAIDSNHYSGTLLACQGGRGLAASSGIAGLSPLLFTLGTLCHLLWHQVCPTDRTGAKGSPVVSRSTEINTLFTIPLISINGAYALQLGTLV